MRFQSFVILSLGAALGCGGESRNAPASGGGNDEAQTASRTTPGRGNSSEPVDHEAPVESDPPPDDPETDEPRPGQVFRRSDNRPAHDDDRLAQLGIRRYDSKRLVLYTDVDPAVAKTLPPLVDAAYGQWVEYFGELPPTREGTSFQITGYLMADEARFKAAGLVPRDLPRFLNGRHRDYEFWMYDQEFDYYRRHLLLHEATHCFTTCLPGVKLPIWYLEGIAELFATHSVEEGRPASLKLRVMPDDKTKFEGLGRITLIEEAVEQGEGLTLREVAKLPAAAYLKPDAYAWAWAATRFYTGQPRFQGRFVHLGRRVVVGGEPFDRVYDELFGVDASDIRFGWTLFVRDLEHGYDEGRAAAMTFVFMDQGRIRAERGWQHAHVDVTKGKEYVVTATGTVTLAAEPVPWTSEANGVSIRYVGGQPIGRLLGLVRTDPHAFEKFELPEILALGNETRFIAPASGKLYLRVNDAFDELADNEGAFEVSIEAAPGER